MLMGISVAVSALMIIVAYSVNRKPSFAENKGLAKVLEHKWYVDELYDAVIVRPIEAMSRFLDKIVERRGIDGIVNSVGKTVRWGGDRLRLLQSGQVGFYIFMMVLGMVVLFSISFFWIK
jgi:NADH-quinone oxidoreductase subunit L